MALAEVIAKGLFDVLRSLVGLAGMLLVLYVLASWYSSQTTRGKTKGQLNLFHPRRFFCKHSVSHYTAGEHGLWALWCADCGRKVNRK